MLFDKVWSGSEPVQHPYNTKSGQHQWSGAVHYVDFGQHQRSGHLAFPVTVRDLSLGSSTLVHVDAVKIAAAMNTIEICITLKSGFGIENACYATLAGVRRAGRARIQPLSRLPRFPWSLPAGPEAFQ